MVKFVPAVTEAKSTMAVVRAHQNALKASPPSSTLLKQWPTSSKAQNISHYNVFDPPRYMGVGVLSAQDPQHCLASLQTFDIHAVLWLNKRKTTLLLESINNNSIISEKCTWKCCRAVFYLFKSSLARSFYSVELLRVSSEACLDKREAMCVPSDRRKMLFCQQLPSSSPIPSQSPPFPLLKQLSKWVTSPKAQVPS